MFIIGEVGELHREGKIRTWDLGFIRKSLLLQWKEVAFRVKPGPGSLSTNSSLYIVGQVTK